MVPAPSSSSRSRRLRASSAVISPPALRELEEDLARMAVSVEWLEQVIAGVPQESAALRTLHGYVDELTSLMNAIERVVAAGRDARLAVALDRPKPLFAYLKALYAWTEALAEVFEEIASGLRRREPVRPVFLLRSINASYARLDGLMHATRASLRASPPASARGEDVARAFDADIEELSWAASWLHLSLTKRFGE